MYKRRSFMRPVCEFAKMLSVRDLVWGVGITLFFAYFFYRSFWAIPFMVPVGILTIRLRQEKDQKEKNRYHLEQFKECIISVETSLRAGYAVENAFVESIRDMKMMFGESSRIVGELLFIQKGLRNNETLESLLLAVARESVNGEVAEFAEVFSIAKRNSGNVSGVIDIYSEIISQRLESEQEIQTLLASKRMEQRIMNVMPFAMVLYLDFANPGYFDVLFHNLTGVILMSACLIVYLTAFLWSEKIFNKTYG